MISAGHSPLERDQIHQNLFVFRPHRCERSAKLAAGSAMMRPNLHSRANQLSRQQVALAARKHNSQVQGDRVAV